MISMDEPLFRAAQIHQWLFSHQAASFDEMTTLSIALRHKLKETFVVQRPELIDYHESSEDNDVGPTRKVLLKLQDNEMVESVLIPSAERITACVSSQAGCQFGCNFCATGTMGFRRNLSAGEISGQIHLLNTIISAKVPGNTITNVVFMGMGEPLLNTDNVIEAIQSITTRNYRFSLSQKKITISTVGVIPEIRRLGNLGIKAKLAVSLHSAEQQKRELLMPVAASRYPLKELGKTLAEYTQTTGMPVTIVYMLLKGINDSQNDAKMLARFSGSFLCKINLIDYNPIININFEPVDRVTRDMFQHYLIDSGLHVTVRKSYGTTINAACGQLAAAGYVQPR